MNIGVIGSGAIGGAVGALWAEAGHTVLFAASREETARKAADAAGYGARSGSAEEAARFGDVLLIATPFKAWPDLAPMLGAEAHGKIVVDATNPFPARDGAIAETAREAGQGSGAFVQRLAPDLRIVKAFNTLYVGRLRSEAHRPEPVAMPIAGDEAAALDIVAALVRDAGFAPVPLPGITSAARFDAGTPVYDKPMGAAALSRALGIEGP